MQRRKDNKGRVLKEGESFRKSDNRYVYRWTSKNGKRHSIYNTDLAKLREEEEKVKHDLRDGLKVDKKNVSINDVYDAWFKDKKGLKKSSYDSYSSMYEMYIRKDFGGIQIQDVTKPDVRRFYNELIEVKGLSIATIEHIHKVLHQVFNLALESNFIRNNPSNGILKNLKKDYNYVRPKRHALTIQEQKALIEFLKRSKMYGHWLPLFTFFLGTGCRYSEACGLRWEDVNMEDGYIDINHNLIFYDDGVEKSHYYISTTKTKASERIIPMLPEVKQALLNELAHQKERGITCKMEVDGYTNFVFLTNRGTVHNSGTINKAIKHIVLAYNEEELKKANEEDREPNLLSHFSCHNFRHTFCTRYCENETNIKVIQAIMGHSSYETTMNIYAEVTKEAKVSSIASLQGKIQLT